MSRRIEEIRQAKVYGVRREIDFNTAAVRFLTENDHLASLDRYADALKNVQPFIGYLSLKQIHMGCLQEFIKSMKKCKKSIRTINYSLQAVRRILNLAATEWVDEHGLTWLHSAAKIKLLSEHDKRLPYPLSWEEQEKLFAVLPEHLRLMAEFAVNSGCRQAEICQLQWAWEVNTTNVAGGSVFIIPKMAVKNREERLVILNHHARRIIEKCRGAHDQYVFTYRGKPLTRINGDGWQAAREKVNLPEVRVHDLKHTLGRRLRAAGVSFEDRQDLLGHKSLRITTHYSGAELGHLYDAVNKVCRQDGSYPTLTMLKRQSLSLATVESKTRKNPARLILAG